MRLRDAIVLCCLVMALSAPAWADLPERPCAAEPNITEMTFDEIVRCKIEIVGDNDTFRFFVQKGDDFAFNVYRTAGGGNQCASLLAPDGKPVGSYCTESWRPALLRRRSRATITGYYQLRVFDGGDDGTFDYGVSIDREFPHVPEVPKVQFGVPSTGSLAFLERRVYAFQAKTRDKLQIRVVRTAGGAAQCVRVWTVDGVDSDFRCVESWRPTTVYLDYEVKQTGVHYVDIAAGGFEESFSFTLWVDCTGSCTPPVPSIVTAPKLLEFRAVAGAPNPASQDVGVALYGTNTPDWTVSPESTGWLSAAKINGALARAGVNSAALPVGVYQGLVRVTAPGLVPQLVPVTLTVDPPSTCTPTLSKTTQSVTESGTLVEVDLTTSCAWSAFSDKSWAQVYPLSGGSANAKVQIRVGPNFSTAARTATVYIANKTFSISQSAGTGTYLQRFVRQLYFYYFGRLPSTAEVNFQVNSGATQSQLVSSFSRSAEFAAGGRFVAGLYVGVLNRDAEFGGWLFQRNALSSGVVVQKDLVRNFINSGEFKGKHGAISAEDYVKLLYRQILLREATPSEVTFQAGSLTAVTDPTAHAEKRVELAAGFLNSNEFRIGTGPRLTAFLIYATLLQRDPTAAERQTVISSLEAGHSESISYDGALNLDEFKTSLN